MMKKSIRLAWCHLWNLNQLPFCQYFVSPNLQLQPHPCNEPSLFPLNLMFAQLLHVHVQENTQGRMRDVHCLLYFSFWKRGVSGSNWWIAARTESCVLQLNFNSYVHQSFPSPLLQHNGYSQLWLLCILSLPCACALERGTERKKGKIFSF